MLHARLILKARGIARTPETLAGAMLEAECTSGTIAFVRTWFEIKKAEAKAAKRGKR